MPESQLPDKNRRVGPTLPYKEPYFCVKKLLDKLQHFPRKSPEGETPEKTPEDWQKGFIGFNDDDLIVYRFHHGKREGTMFTTWELSDLCNREILIRLHWRGEDACPSALWPKKILERLIQEDCLIHERVKHGFFWWLIAYSDFNAMDSALPDVIDLMRTLCGVRREARAGPLLWATDDV